MSAEVFDAYDYETVVEMVPDVDEEWFQINRLFIEDGNYWQDGDGWSGPRLDDSHPLATDALNEIERTFVSEDVLQEIIDRHTQGVTGNNFTWSVVMRTAEGEEVEPNEELINEAKNLLSEWISKRGIKDTLKDAIASTLWSGRGPLRLYVPPGQRDDSGTIPTAELHLSIMRIFVDSPTPAQATVAEDADTKDEIGIYTYSSGDEDLAELVYLDDPMAEEPKTILRVTGGESEEAVPLDFHGRLTMYEIKRDRMINEAMVRNQKKVNHAATAEQSNLATAGWIARLILNGQMPGDYKRNPDGTIATDNDGRPIFEAEPMVFGANTVNYVVGVTTQDEMGNERLATPSYVREEPSSPETFLKTKERTYRYMLGRAQQAYAFLADDGRVSGESRLRARGDYEASLTTSKDVLEPAIEWMLETVLTMAATFSGKPGYFNELRVNAEAQLDVGITTPDERRIAVELWEKQAISKRTMLSWLGIQDTEAELEQIEQELMASEAVTGGETEVGSDDNTAATPTAVGEGETTNE